MMTKNQISVLLPRFINGETTELEELQMAQYFATVKEIPMEWQEYKLMFDSFDSTAYDFSEEQLDSFCQEAEGEHSATEATKLDKPSKTISLHRQFRAIGIAASVAALIGIGLGSLHLYKQDKSPTIAISNQQVAKPTTTTKAIIAQAEHTTAYAIKETEKDTHHKDKAMTLPTNIDTKADTPTNIDTEAETPMVLDDADCGMPYFDNATLHIAAADIAQDHAQGEEEAPYMESEIQNLAYRSQHTETASIASSDEVQFSIGCIARQEPEASAVSAEYENHY